MRKKLWILLGALPAFPGTLSGLTITEVMYHPPGGDRALQYVEVFNEFSTVLDVSLYHFSRGLQFTFPEGTFIPGRGHLVVCADAGRIRRDHGVQNAVGDFAGSLDPGGETLQIVDVSGRKVAEVSYRDRGKWPSSPKGTGHSLSHKSPYLDADDGVNWSPSFEKGGTPGRLNFASSNPGLVETELIAPGSVWKYKKGAAEFSNPLPAWRESGFDDGGWLAGPAGIGYGDGDDATVLPDMQNGYLSIACRKAFTVTQPQLDAAETMVLLMNYDDGFAANLNGIEVARAFLGNPGEDTPHDAPAAGHEAGAWEEFFIPRERFQAGPNVLCIQTHNSTLGSTDLSFIPRLVSRREAGAGGPGGAPVLNEVFSRTGGERWIEIWNPRSIELDLAGYRLSDDPLDLARFTFPGGTTIAAGGFLTASEAETGLSLGGPEVTLFLSFPGGEGMADARVIENDAARGRAGTSDARHPDGSPAWVLARTPTPGAPNRLEVERDLVLNEIMYDPYRSRRAAGQPLEVRPGEYIELHNSGQRTLDLSGFAFTRGVDFTFPEGTSLGPGGYLVVAEDPAYITSAYGIAGVLGPWTGSLQNDGEAIRLEDPLGNTVDEVRYGEGGDWSELADGNGSSLELIDPRQDNSAGSAWAASDETEKAPWTLLSYNGTYASQVESAFHFTPLEAGSFLLDDVELKRGTIEHAPNGGFESGTAPWVMEGTVVHSRRITTEARSGSACLLVLATGRGDMRTNRLAVPTTPAMTPGPYTVRFWGRWRHGGNLILAHGYDSVMARTLWLPVPRNLGTPGLENSATAELRAAAGPVNLGPVNLGPVVARVDQSPVRPGAGRPVTVKAGISDADGVGSAQVFYRTGGRGNGIFTPLDMTPGAGGTFSAAIPGQAVGTKVLFFVEATDATGASRRYPVDAPDHTLLYQAGGAGGGGLIHYRYVLDDEAAAELDARQLHSEDPLPGTFVFDDSEIYYNVGIHYHGSPWGRPSRGSYKLMFPGDRKLHGQKKFNVSIRGYNQNEATAYYTVGRMGTPASPVPRGDYGFVRWELNGIDQGVRSHVETVNSPYVDRWYPGDRDGLLFKTEGKVTFSLADAWTISTAASFQYLGTDKESYRWAWELHTRVLEDGWGPLFDLMMVMDVNQTATGSAFDARIKELLDVESMVKVLAVRVMNDDWDALGIGGGHNAYLYHAPGEGRWKYIPWDMDNTFANFDATFAPASDSGVTRLLSRPEFRRIFLSTFETMLERTWTVPRLSPILDATSQAGVASGQNIKDFITARTPLVRNQIGAAPGAFRITTNGGRDHMVNTRAAAIEGEAPYAIHTIFLGEAQAPGLVWLLPRKWRATVDLVSGANELEFFGFDVDGDLVARTAFKVTSTFDWLPPVIGAIEPPEGPEAGGTPVVLRGDHFHEGIKVEFGSAAAASVEFLSRTEVRALTPPGTGIVPVKATNLDRRTGTLAAGFSYSGPEFIRGDADGDGVSGLNDVIRTLEYLFRERALPCLKAADAGDDGQVDIGDPIRLLFFLFSGGAILAPPHPSPGPDPTPDALSCASGG